MKTIVLLLACLFVASPLAAQAWSDADVRNALRWDQHQRIAGWTSTALVGVALVVPCWRERTKHCLVREGVNVGAAVGVAELTKRLIHRDRPNQHDRLSFFSEHTELACLGSLQSKAWALCPAVGYLRIAADWHWFSDVGTGAAVGAVLSRVTW